MKPEVMGFFVEFYGLGSFERSLNATFLVLVPKKRGTDDLKDFRPISLVGGLYKLLAKVLVNRFKKVVGFLVSDFQHAFVAGRQILDVMLIANEAIDHRIKDNLRGVLCKLDIKKASGHVNWNFILAIMEKMGFCSKWTGWIRWCISTARFFVLVNDSLSGFFHNSRGLRQGDPLSPYLFILAKETLSHLLSSAKEDSFINGFLVRGRNGVGVVSHLFANNTLILCNASKENLEYLSWVFMWFEACSGLKINLRKSEIIPVGNVPNLEELANVLECKVRTT